MSDEAKVVPELLRCPFSHKGRKRQHSDPRATTQYNEDAYWEIVCPVCLASTANYQNKQDAIAAWNARAIPTTASPSEAALAAAKEIRVEVDGWKEEDFPPFNEEVVHIAAIIEKHTRATPQPQQCQRAATGPIPCPKCGVARPCLSINEHRNFIIFCRACGIELVEKDREGEDALIARWNTRR